MRAVFIAYSVFILVGFAFLLLHRRRESVTVRFLRENSLSLFFGLLLIEARRRTARRERNYELAARRTPLH